MANSFGLSAAYEELKQKHLLLTNEYRVTQRKLESKNDALLILSRDLAASQAERDQFKLMADQLRHRCQALKKQLQTEKTDPSLSVYHCPISTGQISSQLQVDDLKQRLADAEGDIKILREKIIKHRLGMSEQQQAQRKSMSVDEREDLIKAMEKSQLESSQLERDMKQILDSKEELETERDAYKTKYERLNAELNFIMRGDEKQLLDIDGLLMENKFLQERVKQLREEKSVVCSTLKKYKHMVEKKTTSIFKTTTTNLLGGVLISQRQVKQLLSSADNPSTHTPQMTEQLKNLASTLLETISDKNLALSHQRKNNKLLANRITDLEKKLHEVEMSVGTSNLKERFEGWSGLRDDCTRMRSLIPTGSVDSSETDTVGESEEADDLSELASVDLDSHIELPETNCSKKSDDCVSLVN
ncbi:coiled-coil domain-containing protein 149-like [Watersipora subatra]|uniref:coiled-coil domain-containing protein 149-like n=1 Tax=Watersipora subatra TaxID=2589382 RepID=UPI00355BBDD9